MICLDRFQKVLAAHLDIDFDTLPSIADVLIARGFSGMSVGERITYFDEQAIKRVREAAEASASKGVDNYNPNFSKDYEHLSLRGGEVESIKSKNDFMLESNNQKWKQK